MSRKMYIYGAIAILILIAAGGASVAGLFLYRTHEEAQWLTAGDAYLKEGVYNRAKASYVNYIARNRTDIDALRKYATAASLIPENRRKNLSDAATAYHQIERYLSPDSPEHQEIVVKLTELYGKLEAWGDLQFFAEQQLGLNPDDADLRLALADAYMHQSRFEDAQAQLQLLLAQNPETPEAYRMSAEILANNRMNTQAQQVLDDALALMPDDPDMYAERARYFWQNRDQSRALAELDKALALNPDHAKALFLKSQYLVSMGAFEEAATVAEKAIKVDPSRPETYGVLAHAYRRTNRTQEAIELLAGLDPLLRSDLPTLLLAHAEMLFSEGDIEGGKAIVAEYAADFPEHRIVREYFQGRIALLENRPEEAAKILQVVYKDQPAFTPAQYFLAIAYLQAGERESARETLDLYIHDHPEDQLARAVMAQEFGRHQDMQTLIEVARGKLANPTSSAKDIVAAAGPLIDAGLSRGQAANVEGLARDLLQNAIERDPTEVSAYRGLMDLDVALGNVDAAKATLAKAIGEGIPEESMALSVANLALKQNDTDKVVAMVTADLNSAEAINARGEQWLNFLFLRGEPGIAETVFDAVSKYLPAGEDAIWGLRRAEMLARTGRLDDAASVLSENEKAGGNSAFKSQLEQTQVVLAQQFAQTPDGVSQASALVDKVLEENPQNVSAAIVKADLLAGSEPPDYEGADALLREVLERSPTEDRALMARAALALRRGDLTEALQFADQAISINPGLIAGIRLVGELHLQLNELREARSHLEKAVERYPRDPQLKRMLILTYLRQGLGREAEKTLAELEQQGADDPEAAKVASAMRGQYLEQLGQATDAESMLRDEFEKSPNDPNAASNLAENLLLQGKQDDAFSLMEGWTQQHATNAAGWIALSRLYQNLGTRVAYGKSSTALTRALVAEPRNLSALRDMTELQMRMNNYVNAATFADRFLSIRPDDAEMIYRKATLLARERSRLEDALTLVDQAIALRADAEYRTLRGFIYLALEKYDAALKDLETVANSYSTTPAELDLALSEGYLGVKNLNMGRRFYELAIKKAGEGQTLDADRLARVESVLKAG